jgi:hypothetical protein
MSASAGDIASVIGGLAALGAIASYAQRSFRRTLGRRRDNYDRLARLGTGAHLSFFESALGQPPAIRQTVVNSDYKEWVGPDDDRFDPVLVADPELGLTHAVTGPRSFLRSVFVDRDFYVQTITDEDGTVLAFSVTTRTARFTPSFEWPPPMGWRERRRISKMWGEKYKPLFQIRLGKSKFSDFGDEERDDFAGPHFKLTLGAHNYAYSEFKSWGNPSAYQSFAFTASDVASGAWGDGLAALAEIGGGDWPRDRDLRSWDELVATRAFRRATVVTTYTVISMDLWLENYPTSFGPHINIVRTLP